MPLLAAWGYRPGQGGGLALGLAYAGLPVLLKLAGLAWLARGRPGAAALDLCYVAAGYYDAFFETGLQPWDVAAGSLIVTEAGGLVGNFTGEADFLHQREVVAGTPRIYAPLVAMLSPYTRVIKEEDLTAAPAPAPAAEAAAAAPAVPKKRAPVRIKKGEAGEAPV